MRAIVYVRVSTEQQARSGLGIEAQIERCQEWARKVGADVVGPFVDADVSSVSPLDQRPGLILAIAALAKGDALVVARRDRLGRDPMVVAVVEAAARRKAGRVVSASGEGTDSDDPSEIMMRRIIDAFAEYERLVTKARTKAALGAKRQRGERAGGVPAVGARPRRPEAQEEPSANPLKEDLVEQERR
ncbi:MAG: recombinase family protein [Singulisphaera sp.]